MISVLSSCPQHEQGAAQGCLQLLKGLFPDAAVQVRGLPQNPLLKVMQCFPCHLGASKIAPCPSLSVCPCCCSAGLEQWGLRELSPGVLSGQRAGDVCWDGIDGECVLVLQRLLWESCCKAEPGPGGKLVSKQILLPCSCCRQLCGSRAVAAPCHEPSTAPAPNQQSGCQPAPGPA